MAVALARLVVVLIAILLNANPVFAQTLGADSENPIGLIADRIEFDNEAGTVTAIGGVEVYYGQRTLTANRIVYNDKTRRIQAEGMITIRDPDGTTVFADEADLDAELRDGLVRGARALLAENAKLSAVEARRTEQRYNQLSKAVYTPCDVCPDSPTPFWRIRARRIIHDEVDKIVHYESATFEFGGVPAFWLPYFQHPDPTVKRASGILFPRLIISSDLGPSFKIPVFIVIDDSTDVTLTPFLTTRGGQVIELEVRRAFETGTVRFGGSVTNSDYDESTFRNGVQTRPIRGHVETDALFRFGDRWTWGWDVIFASDDDYLSDFALNSSDRLESELFLRRYAEESYVDVAGVYFQSFRDNEPVGNIPFAAPVFEARYEFDEDATGGRLSGFTSGHVLQRNSGRDVTRITLGADWERSTILPWGLEVTGFSEARLDMFSSQRDPDGRDGTRTRVTGQAGVEARFPLLWEHQGGMTQIIEPIAQAIIAPAGGNGSWLPAEDSVLSEFDETNVIDRTHFVGLDNVEEGARVNLAVRYALDLPDTLEFDAAFGRVFRADEVDAFSSGSGLREAQSDYVVAWSARWNPYLSISQRMRFGGNGALNRNTVSGSVSIDPVQFNVQYLFFEPDPEVGATEEREEVTANLGFTFGDNWAMRLATQRDLTADRFVSAGGEISYRNECCEIAFYLSHSFSDENDLIASTTGGLRITLATLGTGDIGTGVVGTLSDSE